MTYTNAEPNRKVIERGGYIPLEVIPFKKLMANISPYLNRKVISVDMND